MPNMTTTTMMSALTDTQDALSILIAKIGENDSSVIGPVAYSIANKGVESTMSSRRER